MITFRRARAEELARAYEVFYANEVKGEADPAPLPTTFPAMLDHIWRTGLVDVAEEDGEILAFAGSITREKITFLTDLFVHPARQSARLGQALLQRVLPPGEEITRCTLSSNDPRAQALYMRAGLRPQWPHFSLLLENTTRARLPALFDLEIAEASAGDPALLHWDTRVSGRQRPQDHAFWTEKQRGVPLWFNRGSQTLGYGYVRLGAGTLAHPAACTIGPIGADNPVDARLCVLAAVQWACQHASAISIEVPGPHPCLTSLLEAGFHIRYADTCMTSSQTLFFDPTCYVASDSSLF